MARVGRDNGNHAYAAVYEAALNLTCPNLSAKETGFDLKDVSTGNVIEVVLGMCMCFIHGEVTFTECKGHSDSYRKIFKDIAESLVSLTLVLQYHGVNLDYVPWGATPVDERRLETYLVE